MALQLLGADGEEATVDTPQAVEQQMQLVAASELAAAAPSPSPPPELALQNACRSRCFMCSKHCKHAQGLGHRGRCYFEDHRAEVLRHDDSPSHRADLAEQLAAMVDAAAVLVPAARPEEFQIHSDGEDQRAVPPLPLGQPITFGPSPRQEQLGFMDGAEGEDLVMNPEGNWVPRDGLPLTIELSASEAVSAGEAISAGEAVSAGDAVSASDTVSAGRNLSASDAVGASRDLSASDAISAGRDVSASGAISAGGDISASEQQRSAESGAGAPSGSGTDSAGRKRAALEYPPGLGASPGQAVQRQDGEKEALQQQLVAALQRISEADHAFVVQSQELAIKKHELARALGQLTDLGGRARQLEDSAAQTVALKQQLGKKTALAESQRQQLYKAKVDGKHRESVLEDKQNELQAALREAVSLCRSTSRCFPRMQSPRSCISRRSCCMPRKGLGRMRTQWRSSN